MEEVSKQFVKDGKIEMSTRSPDPYKTYSCVTKFKNDLADHVGDIFARTVHGRPPSRKTTSTYHQYQMTNKMGRLTNKVFGKYVLKADKTMEEIKSIQHVNYIRAVGFDTSGAGPISNINVAIRVMPKT